MLTSLCRDSSNILKNSRFNVKKVYLVRHVGYYQYRSKYYFVPENWQFREAIARFNVEGATKNHEKYGYQLSNDDNPLQILRMLGVISIYLLLFLISPINPVYSRLVIRFSYRCKTNHTYILTRTNIVKLSS